MLKASHLGWQEPGRGRRFGLRVGSVWCDAEASSPLGSARCQEASPGQAARGGWRSRKVSQTLCSEGNKGTSDSRERAAWESEDSITEATGAVRRSKRGTNNISLKFCIEKYSAEEQTAGAGFYREKEPGAGGQQELVLVTVAVPLADELRQLIRKFVPIL